MCGVGPARGARAMQMVLAALGMLLGGSVAADSFEGRAVRVLDGDTLVVVVADAGGGKREEKVRLVGVDCPERGQAWGSRARQALADLTFGQVVRIDWEARDRYGRVLGKVAVGETTPDVGLALIADGHCWWFSRYRADQAARDRREYSEAQTQARREGRGLWSQPDPVPPWEWRRQ